MLTCAVIDAVKISIALALARVLIKVIANKGLRQEDDWQEKKDADTETWR